MACTLTEAYLYDRGGEQRIGRLWPLTSTRWERVRDDISSARIVMHSPDPECHKWLEIAEPGRHELVVFRNGKRSWEGPITFSEEMGRGMEIQAKDIGHYLNRTIMRSAYDNSYPKIGYAVDRVQKILVNELARKEALEPPYNILPYLDIRSSSDGAKTARKTLRYEKYVFEELDQMAAKGGIDYTVIGRSIVVWDTHESIGEGPRLTEADFDGDIAVTTYGMEAATVSAVTDGQGRFSKFGGVDDFYGEIELLHTSFEVGDSAHVAEQLTTEEMAKQAQRNMSGRYPAPVVVRVPQNTTLRRDTVDKIYDLLVPGVRFDVRATKTYRKVEQTQKLDRVVFEETSKGETVKVSLSPAPGTTPWDDSADTSGGEQE